MNEAVAKSWRAREAAGWKPRLIVLALVLAALLVIFARDAVGMARIWWTSSAYEHCLVILPILGWLVWQRLPMLAEVRPRGWTLPLAWVALGAVAWLAGEAGGVAAARHLGLVLMIQGAIAALIGRGATAALLFPLFYALFLVPAGDVLVAPLQTITARLCMVLLHLARVPATLDGVFITTPGGWFKVAEACSGAKFLIAMVALGLLVAHLGFREPWRRAGFLAMCVVVPVLANGVRAFATIWVAQYRGTDAAAGFDHVVYGWIFFAIVIGLVLAVSWHFFDRPSDAPPVDPEAVLRQAAMQQRAWPLPAIIPAVLAIALAAPLWSMAVRGNPGAVPPLRLPMVPGWRIVPQDKGSEGEIAWRPRFDGANLATARYRDASGAEVDLAVAYFSSQDEGRTLVGYGHGAVDPEGPWAWAANLPAPENARAERIVGPGGRARTVLSAYDVGGTLTGSAARVKLETLRRHLIGGDQSAMALLLSSEEGKGDLDAIERFRAALGPVSPALDRIAGRR